jgi:two-component system LytT family response regulator
MSIRTLIVDDEKLARDKLRRLLGKESDISIVGECTCGTDTVEFINKENPELVFLDIQMPELTGFEVLQEIEPEKMPTIIFVTAYDQYALDAFNVHALDYLTKPFNQERLQTALGKARNQIENFRQGDIDERLLSLLKNLRDVKEYPDRLVLKSSGRIYFVKTEDIEWIEAAGNYVKIHANQKPHMLRETMNGIEKKLSPDKFLRIHRSSLVNIDQIKELNPLFSGDYLVTLRDETEITLSRNYHDRLKQLLEKFS